jgi:rod shape-determining protein MreD
MLLVVASWSLLRGANSGLTWALAGGLMLDLLSGGPFGALTISLIVATLTTSLSQRALSRDSLWLPLAAATLATLVYDSVYWLLLQALGRGGVGAATLLPVLLPAVLFNSLVMYPVYWLVRRWHQDTSWSGAV